MRSILFLSDSVNRRFLQENWKANGGEEVKAELQEWYDGFYK